tara:strand:- start:9009 stop:9692 length:684 start_codon:yes stop_codon:yes gene_type:complete
MSVHDCYWSLLNVFRKPNNVDTMRSAQMKLADTIEELKESENTLKMALNEVAGKVKQAQQAKATSKVKQLLVSSASKRNTLSLTTRKRLALEQQLDCIATTQLNQQVLSSMKQTSNAMKTLGLDATLSSVDEVMADMQEANTDVNEITQTLSSSISIETLDDDALNAELELLMSDEADSVLHEPVIINSTKPQKTSTPPVSDHKIEEAPESPITMDPESTVQLEVAA